MKTKEKLSPEQFFKENLRYDELTGKLFWKTKVKNASVGDEAGCKTANGYRVVYANGVQFKGHRVVWLLYYGEWPKLRIDHINGVRDDNRICNLRDVAAYVNSQNLRTASARSTTGCLGVFKLGRKWKASIGVRGQRINLGVFQTMDEAQMVYLNAKRRLHEGCCI
jgi:hypothetical protein